MEIENEMIKKAIIKKDDIDAKIEEKVEKEYNMNEFVAGIDYRIRIPACNSAIN